MSKGRVFLELDCWLTRRLRVHQLSRSDGEVLRSASEAMDLLEWASAEGFEQLALINRSRKIVGLIEMVKKSA